MTFARVFDKQIQTHGRKKEAVEETLRICRDRNVLKDYLAKEEAAIIMFTLLDEQKARKFWEEEIRQESLAEGGINMLASLVKDQLISINEGAKRAGLTVAEFSKKTGIPVQN